ncbi:type II toxin-antitoxin system VapC family toxin [Moraxella marmotae]|uniref:type II toxin-antitoxin system VapC family toxin n=1 Tax=Moraxella marmotae TaxID=3344520 RepID=UPI0035F37D14
MKYLLDTHILLWALTNSPKLGDKAKDIISNYDNELWFSSASVWEIAIKISSGKVKDDELIEPDLFYQTLLQEGYQELTINSMHSNQVRFMPFIHKDPFDRMLIAQAKTEKLIFMTADEKIAKYHDCQLLII